jgi:O-antigen ligase
VVLALLFLFEKKKKLASLNFKLFLPLVLFVFLNCAIAKIPVAAFLKWIKFLELGFVSYLVFSDKRLDIKRTIAIPLAAASIFVVVLAMSQLLLQGSIGGPMYFFGERTFNSGTPGISLYSIFGRSLLRPYATFSHPNSLAGFAGVTFLVLLGLTRRLGQKSQVLYTGAASSLAALFLSGSKAAFLGIGAAAAFYILAKGGKKFFLRSLVSAAVLVLLISLLSPVVSGEINKNGIVFSERVGQRLTLAEVSGRLYSQKPASGWGLNNFIPAASGVKTKELYSWFFQPVHNVPLLVLVETGIVGFGLFSWYTVSLAKRAAHAPSYFGLCLVFILVTASLDHYWMTLQQNQLLLAVLIGLMYRQKSKVFLLN